LAADAPGGVCVQASDRSARYRIHRRSLSRRMQRTVTMSEPRLPSAPVKAFASPSAPSALQRGVPDEADVLAKRVGLARWACAHIRESVDREFADRFSPHDLDAMTEIIHEPRFTFSAYLEVNLLSR